MRVLTTNRTVVEKSAEPIPQLPRWPRPPLLQPRQRALIHPEPPVQRLLACAPGPSPGGDALAKALLLCSIGDASPNSSCADISPTRRWLRSHPRRGATRGIQPPSPSSSYAASSDPTPRTTACPVQTQHPGQPLRLVNRPAWPLGARACVCPIGRGLGLAYRHRLVPELHSHS